MDEDAKVLTSHRQTISLYKVIATDLSLWIIFKKAVHLNKERVKKREKNLEANNSGKCTDRTDTKWMTFEGNKSSKPEESAQAPPEGHSERI